MLHKAMHLLEASFQTITEVYAKFIPRKQTQSLRLKPGLVAHRGLITHPNIKENTMLGFNECLQKNIWGIEFDIRWTKDLIPVVHHDASAKRVWGKDILIHELNINELKQQLPEIPTLEEVCLQFGKKMHLMIEVKKLPQFKKYSAKTMTYNLNKALHELSPQAHYHFMSFQPEELIDQLKLPPHSIFSITTTDVEKSLKLAKKLGLEGVTGHFTLITAKKRAQAQAHQLKIGVGFINSRNSLLRELHLGADYLFTNKPFLIQDLLNKIPHSNAEQ